MTERKDRKLLDQVRDLIRIKHYSPRTEKTYVQWMRRYILFHNKRHPVEMGQVEIEAYLSYLAQVRRVAASTQNQALNAILFLYREVLNIDMDSLNINAVRAKRRVRMPTVLTQDEVVRVLSHMYGLPRLAIELMYGGGLRIQECLDLRVQNIDIEDGSVVVVDSKSRRDRRTLLPKSIGPVMKKHLESVRFLHEQDLERGYGSVELPYALGRKYKRACKELCWQYAFPAKNLFHNKETGERGRWHMDRGVLQRSIRSASRKAGIMKRVTSHVFRHSFATHMLENGHDIRTVQELLGHAMVKTTMIYTHVMKQNNREVASPLDELGVRDRL